jgi:catecholate siderophore receptor
LIDAYAGTLSYGFDDSSADSRLRATLDLNHNLTRSPIPGTAIRLNGLYQSGGVAGRDYAERNSWGVAPSVAFGLGTPTRVIFAYQYLDLSDIPDLGVPGVLAPGIHAIHAASGLPFLPPADHIPRDIFYGRTSDFDDVSSHSFIARFEHDFASGATLTNQTRISDTNREALYTLPFGVSPLPAVGLPTLVDTRLQANDRQTQTYSNLTNFAMEFETGALKHSIATGLELSREEGSTGRVFTNLGGADLVDIANPDPSRPRPLPGPQSPGERDFVRIDTAAVYAYDTLELSRQWQLTGGFRLEHYDAEIKSTEAAYDTYRTDDTTLSGKLGLVYKPLEYGSIYASGGEFLSNPDGSRSATPIPGSSGQNARGSDTQESTNYELGTKWDLLDKRLSTTLAAFHTRRDNIAFGSEPDLSYGDQTVYGLEWGISGAITENWMIFGGAAYMESETRVGAGIDSTLALTPRWSGNLFTTYHFDKPGLTIGGGLQYVGSSAIGRPSNTFNGSPGATATAGELPSYLTFNALLAYELNQNVTLRLNVDNVFDEEYTTSANFPGTRAYLGAPRTFTISADWKF